MSNFQYLPGTVPSSAVCTKCEKLGSDIVKTKQAITKLHRRLAQAVSKLTDFAILGQKILEEDLLDGGLSETLTGMDPSHSLVVRVLVDSRLDIATLDRDSAGIAKYAGQFISEENAQHEDDGSSPLELEEDVNDDHCIFLSQQEWANAGLFVKKVRTLDRFYVFFSYNLLPGSCSRPKSSHWRLGH